MTQTKKTTPEVSPEENVEIKTTHLADGSTVVEKSFSKMIPPPPNSDEKINPVTGLPVTDEDMKKKKLSRKEIEKMHRTRAALIREKKVVRK
jgi:hypothetical protein